MIYIGLWQGLCRLILLLSGIFIAMGTPLFSWSISSAVHGSYSYGYVTTPAANANLQVFNPFSDEFSASAEGVFFLNRPVFDGNGNYELMHIFGLNAVTAFSPSSSLDVVLKPMFLFAFSYVNPDISLDGRYYFQKVMVGLNGGYGYKAIDFSGLESDVEIHNPYVALYFTAIVSPVILLDISCSHVMNIFSTSGEYSETLFIAGFTWEPEKEFLLALDAIGGFDSVSNLIAGAQMEVVWTFVPALSLLINGSYRYYSSEVLLSSSSARVTTQPQGNSPAGQAAGPGSSIYSVNSTFEEFYVSAGMEYTYEFYKPNDLKK